MTRRLRAVSVRRHELRRWGGLSWLVAGLAWQAAVHAQGDVAQLPSLALPPDSRTHELAHELRLNGVRAMVRVLDVALPIDEAVPALAAQFPAAPAILRDSDQVILVGAGVPWRLTLRARGRRTLGVLSMLNPAAAGTAAARPVPRPSQAADAPLGWLPPGAERRLGLTSKDRDADTMQHIVVHPRLSPAQLTQQAFAGLARDGWTPEQPPQAAISVWRRGPTQLTLSVVPAGRASGLLAIMTTSHSVLGLRNGGSSYRKIVSPKVGYDTRAITSAPSTVADRPMPSAARGVPAHE